MSKAARFGALLLACGSLSWGTACGSSSPKAESPALVPVEVEESPAPKPGIAFEIDPPDAEVFVDGESLGSAAEVIEAGDLILSAGLHQIMIRHDDFETSRVEVTIGEKTELLQINLQAKTP